MYKGKYVLLTPDGKIQKMYDTYTDAAVATIIKDLDDYAIAVIIEHVINESEVNDN